MGYLVMSVENKETNASTIWELSKENPLFAALTPEQMTDLIDGYNVRLPITCTTNTDVFISLLEHAQDFNEAEYMQLCIYAQFGDMQYYYDEEEGVRAWRI